MTCDDRLCGIWMGTQEVPRRIYERGTGGSFRHATSQDVVSLASKPRKAKKKAKKEKKSLGLMDVICLGESHSWGAE